MSVRTVTAKELEAGCESEFAAYLDSDEKYLRLGEACQEAAEKRETAIYIPGVELVISAVLDTLNQPSVKAKLPKEVNDRHVEALKCTDRVSEYMRKKRNLPEFLKVHSKFFASSAPITRNQFRIYTAGINGLARAPFEDACMLAGGSVRVMEDAGINSSEYAEILARSTGLLEYSKISQRYAGVARTYLGQPYASRSHYIMGEDDNGAAVNFTDETHAQIQKWQENGGCPARRIRDPLASGQSVLTSSWQRITGYLAPEGATASDTAENYLINVVQNLK